MLPVNSGFAKRAEQQFVVGETYRLEERQDRSSATHAHYFASIGETWKNLPEELLERYPTPEALRKRALVKAGFCDERSIVCSSKAEALRVGAFIKPMDEYAVVVVRENVVRVFTPQSQSIRAMDRKIFQESKEKVLAILADLVGVTPKQLSDHAAKAEGER